MANNIVLLCLDTVRKDFYDRFAPRLQNRTDVSFEQCRAASSWSVPSHASMFSGRLPSQHGIHAYNRNFFSLTRDETFLGDLPDFESIGVSANAYASDEFGFDGLFEEFSTVNRRIRYPDGINISEFGKEYSGNHRILGYVWASLNHPHPLKCLANGVFFKASQLNEYLPIPNLVDDGASLVAKEVRRQVKETTEPFVQYVNFMDAHGPLQHHRYLDKKFHDAPNSWNSASEVATWDINEGGNIDDHETSMKYLRGLYAASIDYLDRTITSLIDDIQRETVSDTIFVITSDHGENLGYPGDEYLFEHTGSLSEGLLHVPFGIINAPDYYETPKPGYLSHLDLGTLITGLANGDAPSPIREVIASEVIGGNHFPEGEKPEFWDRSIRCAYKGKEKVVWDSLGNSSEYVLSDNPSTQEEVNTDISVPAWALDQFPEDIATVRRDAKRNYQETEVSAQTQQRLRDLGYTAE